MFESKTLGACASDIPSGSNKSIDFGVLMTLPASLVNQVKNGRAILFLGAGALIGADLQGKSILMGDGLRDLLNEQFLGGEYNSESLAHVAALAMSQNSFAIVQDFIGDYLRPLRPANFHFKIPEFKWRALFTTNYDRLIEICYEENSKHLQEIVLMLSNSDKIDETRTTNDKVALIKLHGCITRTHDESLPLILTVDQYSESLNSRSRLFSHLYELAYENSIIFIGHRLQDPNIRTVLLMLHKEAPQGQRHYLVKPGVKDAERDYWAEKKITSLDYSFEDFMEALDGALDKSDRTLSLVRPITKHPIEKRFVTHSLPSDALLHSLTDNLQFLSDDTPYSQHSPREFFKGADQGWFPIAEELGINRTISNRIWKTVIGKPEAERKCKTELYVIKGEAGSGKTILMRQLAWNAKNLGIGIFIWVKASTTIDVSVIQEIYAKTSERVFLIWDDSARNSDEISRCLARAKRDQVPVTILTSERFSEWNTTCGELDNYVMDVFKLPYLDEAEITHLIGKLSTYDCLGPNLIGKSEDERKREFREIYGRQLLVALYEATLGIPFEDIIHNEYVQLFPVRAKEIYLTVCTLNRMRVPVRAGLISRIHGVSFETFEKKFFKPLERVVITDGSSQLDYHYKARHPEIADIVFRRALTNSVDRYNEYIRILKKLNISYESDKYSFRCLVKAKSLKELFPSFDDVQSIYEFALEAIGDDPYLFQQIANFERIRLNGNLIKAVELLDKARAMAPHDTSILHSLAMVWRERARQSADPASKLKYRGESRAWLEAIIKKSQDDIYSSCTLVDLALDELSDLLTDDSASDRSIDEAIRRAEKGLMEIKRRFPSDEHIFSIEAKFAGLVNDDERAIFALEKSFSENNRDPFIATRLASVYAKLGDKGKALETLRDALARRPSDHRLNFQIAELLRETSGTEHKEIAYYYRRAYTPGDRNYQAQFWHARFSFDAEDEGGRNRSKEIFRELRTARLGFDSKVKVRDYMGGSDSPAVYLGSLDRKNEGFGFVRIDGSGLELFFPLNEAKEDMWEALQEGDRLRFRIGFSFNGPVCCDVEAV